MTKPRETPIPEAAAGKLGEASTPESREDQLAQRVTALEGQVRELQAALAKILERGLPAARTGAEKKAMPKRGEELDWEMGEQFEMNQFITQFIERLRVLAHDRDIQPLRGFDLRKAAGEIEAALCREQSETKVQEFIKVIEEKILAPLARALLQEYLTHIVRVGEGEKPPRNGYEHIFPLLDRSLEILNTQGGTPSLYTLPRLGEQFDPMTMEKNPGLEQVRTVRTDALRDQPYVFLPVKFGLRDRANQEVEQKATVIVW